MRAQLVLSSKIRLYKFQIRMMFFGLRGEMVFCSGGIAPSLLPLPSHTMELVREGAATTMAHMVFCVRNKKEMEGLDEPPFDSEFGQKIYKNVSKAAWAEWVDRQKMLLNEYRLQPWTPQAQQFLVEQMEEFFFGAGSALPSEYVPPSH
jgi:Fe-S cluster biosynthesis and repair protein YggX